MGFGEDPVLFLYIFIDNSIFFSAGETTFQSGGFSGLEDFELICFMVVM